jgi:hypothetical protein
MGHISKQRSANLLWRSLILQLSVVLKPKLLKPISSNLNCNVTRSSNFKLLLKDSFSNGHDLCWFRESENQLSFFSPSRATRTLGEMPRDLPKPTSKGHRRDFPQESESYSSTRVHPSRSPYGSRDGSPVRSDRATGQLTTDVSSLSLSVNYLPSKFSSGILVGEGEARRRPGAIRDSINFLGVPKMGGGIDVFKSGEARMGGEGDDDEEEEEEGDVDDDKRPPTKRWFVRGRKQNIHPHNKKLRWNRFKWILFGSNTIVGLLAIHQTYVYGWFFFQLTIYSFIALLFCLLTWFDVWANADVIRVGNRPELIVSTLAASIGIFTSLIGWAGILMNNRSFLAVYTFLLWITFIFLVMPGYITYKRRTFNLEGKINAQWSRQIGIKGRLRIQNQLYCCGYFNTFVEATISQTCYARSVLPGCKFGYMVFERVVLKRWYLVSFALVPFHLLITTAGLLCSNHVTYRFGKGMMPKAYRLSVTSMAIIMDNYAR